MIDLVILGAGGFAREVAWIVWRINNVQPVYRVLGFCDDAPDKKAGDLDGLPLLGPIEGLRSRVAFFCAIGRNLARQAVTARALDLGHVPESIIDPSADIAPDVQIGPGSVVGLGSVVSVGARVGGGVIINHHVCVGHDVRIGDYAQLCPGVCVSGACEIGEGALLGTLAGTIPLKKVGAWATVGAGTCAMRDIPEGATVVRVPR